MLVATGAPAYRRAARVAIDGLLAHTPFDILVAHDGRHPPRRHRRVADVRLAPPDPALGRSGPFLLAFDALAAALEPADATHLLLLDADAVVVRPTGARDVVEALGPHELGMVEQKGIRGGLEAGDLRRFAWDVMTPFFGPAPAGMGPGDLVYFNSGVVLGRAEALGELVAWARALRAERGGAHARGEHMVGDQDYFQHWANVRRQGSCARLPPSWNHCEHWDEAFPAADARILHFSNACAGPGRRTIRRMRAAQRGGVAALAAIDARRARRRMRRHAGSRS